MEAPTALSILLLFAGFLSLLFSAGRLLATSPGYESRLMAAAYLAMTSMFCHAAVLVSGVVDSWPGWLGWYLPGLLCFGPLLLRFAQVRLNLPGRRVSLVWHLAPAVLSVPGLILFLFFDPAPKQELISNVRSLTLSPKYLLILALTSLHPIAYAGIGGMQLMRSIGWRLDFSEGSVRLLAVLLLASGLVSLLLFAGFVSRNPLLLYAGALGSACMVPLLYLLGCRYPYFFDELRTAVERSKYRSTQLKGKDLEEIGRRLQVLMQSRELYKEENLTLPELAASVQLSSHQLSEYFNVQLKVNFSRFVNRYRVEEACKLLVEKPELTVLNIAFAVGFNSKSVFNAAFSRETGLTPTAYRARGLQESKN